MPALALVLGLVAVASCSKKPTKPPDPPGEPGLGTAVIDTSLVAVGSELAWSSATNEICYVENFTFDVNAVGAVNRVRRRLDDQGLTYTLSADGRYLYYRLLDPLLSDVPLVRRDLTSAQRDTLALHVRDFVLSADDSLIAYTIYQDATYDSLYLLRPATGEIRLLTSGVPRAFSPDKTKLLFREVGSLPTETQTVDLQTSMVQPAPLGLPPGSFSYGPRWHAGGVRALYRLDSPSRIMLRDVAAGTDVELFRTTDSLDTTFPKWSRDASKIAFVTHQFTPIGDRRASVWSVDVTTRQGKLVARGPDLTALQTMSVTEEYAEFSPDQRTIAYVVRNLLYTSPIP